MSKVYTSAVVIIPPERIWAPIQEIRRIYDRQINRWMPHINLLYPFRHINEFSNLKKEFSIICGQILSFEISLKIFNYFHHGHQNYTIYLKPEPSTLILKLQENLLKIVPDCNDVNKNKNGFTPHLSVGQIIGKKKLISTLEKLQNQWEELKFALNSIYFISREKNKTSKFRIEKEIALKR
ncbi:MAG: 2'-5' RNA ligase family protein [Candidatus Thorarchaeota archaeon]